VIKRVPVEQLRVGMYVHDLRCDWLDHPFLRNRFTLEDDAQVERIRGLGVGEVDIDTSLGGDVPEAANASELAEHLRPALDSAAEQRPPSFRATTLNEERARARRIQREAGRIVAKIMEDARLGRQLELEPARALIRETVASIIRNQDALLGLNRIRAVDLYTFEHSVNVSVLMVAFARTLGLEPDGIEAIGLGALLHDIGKTRIPEAILNKPGRLSDDEFALIRRHVEYGYDILSQTPGIPSVALDVLLEHHERIEGTGYPAGKSGEAISYYGQMAAIVDVYDALTTERVYHGAISPHEALRKFLEWSPHYFDRALVQQFIRCVGIYPVGTLVRLESERLAVVVETGRDQLLKPVVRLMYHIPSRRRLPPQDLDLAAATPYGQDRILDAEDPSAWGLRPEHLLR
jgi:putative nucleotidyltransferase with HDIG domain